MERLDAWEKTLAAWESALPRSERLIFDAGHNIRIVTPSLVNFDGWRTSTFSTRDHMPCGHMEWKDRFTALKEAMSDAATRIERIPFEVEPLVMFRPGKVIIID